MEKYLEFVGKSALFRGVEDVLPLLEFLSARTARFAKGEYVLRSGEEVTRFGLLLRGKCRYCGTKISVRYLLSELVFAAVTVICLLRFGLTAECLLNIAFFGCLFCLALVDMEVRIIPDGCLIAAALAWAVWLPFSEMPLTEISLHVLAAVVYGGGLLLISLAADKILGKESLGGGDIKLFAVVGLYLGLTGSLFALLLSCVLGLVFAYGRKLFPCGQDEHFPFGPAIAAASWLMLMYGQPLVDWYLGLLGLR